MKKVLWKRPSKKHAQERANSEKSLSDRCISQKDCKESLKIRNGIWGWVRKNNAK